MDVADSQELEQLLKGEVAMSDQDETSSGWFLCYNLTASLLCFIFKIFIDFLFSPAESEDPPSVNPSSVDDNIEDTDTEKDSDGKTASKTPGMDEYEFKDEEEEEDLSKALNDRHIPRRELRQREKEDKDRNHVAGKQNKGDSSSKSKKQKPSHVHCSSDTSSDEMESVSEKRSSPTCSQSSESLKPDGRLKKDVADPKDKGKVKRKSKSQIKNKENQEDGKENSKTLVLSLATVSENTEKCREEDSFKMSFSPKDDSSVHLFHLSSIKAPKLNHSLADKQSPLKQENTKISISDASCPLDKYNNYSDGDYCTESSSTKGCKHREKSKHQQKDAGLDGDDGHSSPYKDSTIGNSLDSSDGALRKTDLDGKVVKKHKIKHKEKDKHRREYEAERSRHRQKEARKDGHRNLEFDREFWKENFFKSDEADELLGVKKEGEDVSSLQRVSDLSPVKDERNSKERHSGSKEKRPREEREKEKAVKKERKEEKVKDLKPSERDEKVDCHGSGWILEEPLQNSLKEEMEEKPISGISADQDQLEHSDKGSREKSDKRLPGKEKDSDKMEKRHLEKEKKLKLEHSDKAEPQNSVERWKEKERTVSSFSLADKSFRENERLKSLSAVKKHEDGRKNKDKFDKRSDRERQERDYGAGDHKDRDRANADRRGKPLEKSSDHSKSDRFKEKDCDRKKRDKIKDGGLSSSSNLKLLLEDKKSYLSESTKVLSLKSKEEVARTPEKDRDRRDRDRDSDRHRDKDKERHKDRSQQAKINKLKPGEADAEKTKSKSSAASRDGKPKEKRLVNDDLMQTSFERMLSMKDQEIELWHRKHLEKIKQKERERLKQRPLADLGKSKPKDRTKSDPYLSKELIRSKSSEAAEVHSRDRSLKDGMSPRTVSLDGKSLPSIGAKVMSAVENCLSRSPRPESERGGLMSRSVSMHSVVSSEDSCQASTLTPRNAEYDSDMNLEASDSQLAFLQSSLIIQAARSPSVHDKDCNSLPDVLQTTRKHESPYLRAILNEDANSSAEGKGAEHLSKSSLTGTPGEELRPKETSEPEETPGSQLNSSSAPDPGSEGDAGAAGCLDSQLLVRDLPGKNLKIPHSSPSETGSAEQRTAPVPDPVGAEDPPCLMEVSQGEDPDPPLTSAASPEPSAPSNTKIFQQRDLPPPAGTENQQQSQSESPPVSEHNDQPVETPDRPEEEDMDTGSENLRTERPGSPVPPTSLPIATSADGEPSPALNTTESRGSEEDGLLNNPDCDDADSCVESQLEDGGSCLSPEHKAEDITDVPQSTEPNRTESSSIEGSLSSEGTSESKPEDPPEPMEVSPPDEKPESSSSSAEELSPTSIQQLAQADSSTASGSSSPQSGDQESDSSGAKLKLRPPDEEADVHVPHPRKRKMPRLSSSQLSSAAQQEKDRCQQSLAAIVDSVKLEEIKPYQTERANPYYEFLHIRKKIEEKRKVLCNVTPQPPQYYDEYVTFNGSYLLDGNPLSKLCIPTVSLLSGLTKPFKFICLSVKLT